MSDISAVPTSRSQATARFDEFQSEAVENIVADYRAKRNGRFLLVIPTGGGKTITAVKAVYRLFEEKILDAQKDIVVWGAHRVELVTQAEDALDTYAEAHSLKVFRERVRVRGLAGIQTELYGNESVPLLVLDEAHHAAASNVQYGPLFDYAQLGILGLTATPSRHDGEPLDFEKESYSIGFPDLVEKQIILAPEIRTISGGRFEAVKASGATGITGLDALNTTERNKQIVGHILENQLRYSKVIIYAASTGHARSLYELLSSSEVASHYESVDFITANDRSGNDSDRKSFVRRLKGYRRSIVINFDVLTEGYDDPWVNTVMMARPTRSKLVYMQAIGRCVRVDPDDLSKRAYVVEVVDDLPNIRYRIDNRWLFSEISDALEPAVEDRFFGSAREFSDTLDAIYEEFNVQTSERLKPEWDKRMRYSLLLFRCYTGRDDAGEETYRHIPIIIDATIRAAVSNWFNFLSERMQKYDKLGIHPEEAMSFSHFEGIPALAGRNTRKLVFEAMEEASRETRKDVGTRRPKPWITFIALRFRRTSRLLPEVELFVTDMVNKDQIIETLLARTFPPLGWLIRLPLPLGGSIGLFLTETEFFALRSAIDQLARIRETAGHTDHRSAVREFLANVTLPLPISCVGLLPAIVRAGAEYFLKLD